jgi:molybdopterin synthase sulfur carrier subunit
MEVVVYGPLRSATGTKRVEVDFDGSTVGDALRAFVEAYPRTADHLYDDEGGLRPSVRLMRDGDRIDVDEACSDGDELALFPAMQGG